MILPRLRRSPVKVPAGPSLGLRPAVGTYAVGAGVRRAVAIAGNGPWEPHLPHYDVIVFNHSGGKDSTAALHELVQLARRLDLLDRVVVLHNDLGRVEWPSTAALDAEHGDYYRSVFGKTLVERFGDRPSAGGLARKHAESYGLPFYVRSRTGGDLLEQIEQYGKFPDAANRHCTSEQKRAPKFKLFTELVRGLAHLGRKVRILDVNGERAEESAARANKPAAEYNRMASNKTRRDVVTWRIIHDWTEEQVWDCHFANDLEWHWAYDAGMSRLSCSLCVLGAVADVTLGCLLRPDLAQEYADLERRINHLFKNGRSITWYIDRAKAQASGCGQASPARPVQPELFTLAL